MPKLAACEDMTMKDFESSIVYVDSLDIYKRFATLTQAQKEAAEAEKEQSKVGRPTLTDDQIENDATAQSREQGEDVSDNKREYGHYCKICGSDDLEGTDDICERCRELLGSSK